MPLELDHLTVIAPSLEAGAAHVRAQIGVEMPAGGQHPLMGTHNLLLRLGDATFLEVIAVDPTAEPPGRPRWFGLDAADVIQRDWAEGRRLRGWVARTDDLDSVLADPGALLGEKTVATRGDRTWHIAVPGDGSLPLDGAAPTAMSWGARGNPARDMPDLGVRLASFTIEHPDPAGIAALYRRLGVTDPPEVRQGDRLRYRAMIETPQGMKELR